MDEKSCVYSGSDFWLEPNDVTLIHPEHVSWNTAEFRNSKMKISIGQQT